MRDRRRGAHLLGERPEGRLRLDLRPEIVDPRRLCDRASNRISRSIVVQFDRPFAAPAGLGCGLKSHSYAVQLILDHFPTLRPEDVTERLRFSSFVSLPKRYLYFEVPKAGCSQMKALLRTLENAPPIKLLRGSLRVSSRDLFLHARENVPLPSLVELDDRTQREVLESKNFFRFAVVRNPYTRLVSAWRNKVLLCEPDYEDIYFCIEGHLPEWNEKKSLVSFEQFVNYIAKNCDLATCNIHWRRQVDHVFLGAINFRCIAKLENLRQDLLAFQQHLGSAAPLSFGGSNVSAPVGDASYTQALADQVYDLYRADFEAFGYDRASWPAGEKLKAAGVPAEKFCHEIIERNLIISRLYHEREWLLSQLHRASSSALPSLDTARVRRASIRALSMLGVLKPVTAFRRLRVRGWMRKVFSGAPPSL